MNLSKNLPLLLLIVGALMLASAKSAALGLVLIVIGVILARNRGRRRLRARSRRQSDDWPQTRREVWEREGRRCRVCRQPVQLSNCDTHHVTPRSKGGQDRPDNLICLCKPCHAKMPNHQHLLRQRQYRS